MLSLHHALVMLWETFWALVLGFGVSAALQVLVSKEQMTRAFGRAGLKEVALATGLGAASSSCSYAAAAAGRSALEKGAAMVPMLAFMFASTNLVIELGAVLWVLMGWRFVLAEFVGSFVLVAVMWILVKFFMPRGVEEEARARSEVAVGGDDHCCHGGDAGDGGASVSEPRAWKQVADASIMDWGMLWKEIFGGFLIAGFLMAVIPSSWWGAFFLTNAPATLRLLENAAVGPLIAVASFVCSVGNIPLASLLWSNGISFGGVISFIYGDLIVIPLILIYAKYYGARAAVYITVILYISMVVSGIVVDLMFAAAGVIPSGPRPENPVEHAQIIWNYTSWLDLVAGLFFVSLLAIHLQKRPAGAEHH